MKLPFKLPLKKKNQDSDGEKKEVCLPSWSLKSRIQLNGGIMLLFAGLIILICVCTSFFVASRIYSAQLKKHMANKVVFNTETTESFQVAKLQDVVDFIESKFGLDYDMNQLIEGAIKGMMDALEDPYSYYIEPGAYDDYQSSISGVYQGIGIEYKITEQGYEILKVYKDTPAASMGLIVGEIITQIDDIDVDALSDEEVDGKLSTVDNEVTLTVQDETGTARKVLVTVQQIAQTSVYYRDLEGGIRYIRIEKFDDDTGMEFEYVLQQTDKTAVKGLIIDLRGNRGGYEREASKVADLILGEGLVAYAQDRNGKRITEIKSDADAVDFPIVMLADGGSASASELVLGAFRDFERGTIVGTKTYGKALGQLSRSYAEDGSGIVLTVSRYFTPSGECIHGVGITPDVAVEPSETYIGKLPEEIPEGSDVQLKKALEEIAKLIEA